MAVWATELRTGAVFPKLLLSVNFITATERETKVGVRVLLSHSLGRTQHHRAREKEGQSGGKSKPLIWREVLKSAHSWCGCGCAGRKKGARVCEGSSGPRSFWLRRLAGSRDGSRRRGLWYLEECGRGAPTLGSIGESGSPALQHSAHSIFSAAAGSGHGG